MCECRPGFIKDSGKCIRETVPCPNPPCDDDITTSVPSIKPPIKPPPCPQEGCGKNGVCDSHSKICLCSKPDEEWPNCCDPSCT